MKKKSNSGIKVDRRNKKNVVISGMANVATPDRGKEIIPGEVWDLDNYSKNNILFFNHDRDWPIGTVESIEKGSEGLKVKRAVLSNSDEPKVKYIRELVEEGVLKTFSVGFDSEEEPEEKEGNLVYKDAELLELSIVTLPMHQDATFSVVQKDFQTKSYDEVKDLIIKSMEEPKEPEEEEEEETKEDPENAFQNCVSSKIPKLLEEGKTQEEATAIAISMCKEEQDGKCTITQEEKQAEQEGAEVPTTPIKTEDDPSDFGSPQIELQKQTNILLGALIAEVQKMNKALEGFVVKEVKPEEEEEKPSEEEEKAEENPENPSEEEETPEEEEEEETPEKKARVEYIAKKIEKINSIFKRCKV